VVREAINSNGLPAPPVLCQVIPSVLLFLSADALVVVMGGSPPAVVSASRRPANSRVDCSSSSPRTTDWYNGDEWWLTPISVAVVLGRRLYLDVSIRSGASTSPAASFPLTSERRSSSDIIVAENLDVVVLVMMLAKNKSPGKISLRGK
jgi:hypothetical protein